MRTRYWRMMYTSKSSIEKSSNYRARQYQYSKKEDIDEILTFIQDEKLNLIKNKKKRKTELYALLSMTEKFEDMEYWGEDGNKQELTFYRRFASLLDVLSGESKIKWLSM
ncbi:MAG: hypothetical protein EXX96DRAFT_611570 [Benjaminiella poitrasii]|nr:MAG: hypothetical protein EXX96DRAFT_611570 [Benjaminiella poitrasii]